MTLLTGPTLDRLRDDLREWFVQTRDRLIQALEEGYPYHSVQLTPEQQVQKFLELTDEDWGRIADKLRERHRGKDNIEELVRKDIQAYMNHMGRLMYRR